MNVLVTGGAGFIGSHVVSQLCDAGATVRVLDLRSDGIDPRAQLIVGDIQDPLICRAAVEGIDAVCHQAAKVGLGVDFSDVDDYVAVNDTGTATLLRALWDRSFTGRFVLASSMVVYGSGMSRCAQHGRVVAAARRREDLERGQFEPPCPHCRRPVTWEAVREDDLLDPQNVYAATKLHQEHLCGLWARESGSTLVALRYHNVYGPRMPSDTPYAGVAAIFRSALNHGDAPKVFEDGGQTRDFVHVRDVARANVLALSRGAGAFNVASGGPRSVLDMAAALARPFGLEPLVTGGWRLGDVRHIVASPRRAVDDLGFTAEIGFVEGMTEFAGVPLRVL